jgi:hypothetical protein
VLHCVADASIYFIIHKLIGFLYRQCSIELFEGYVITTGRNFSVQHARSLGTFSDPLLLSALLQYATKHEVPAHPSPAVRHIDRGTTIREIPQQGVGSYGTRNIV